VNNDGTGWHPSHAFGDFCEFCHAGNVQATDKDAAHTGMVAPLADVQASCSSCHAQDLDARAQVYAAALGVDYGKGGGATGGGQPTGDAAPTPQPASSDTSTSSSSVVVNEPGVIDYNARYEQTTSGGLNVNWGDVIVGVLIVVVGAGGGGFVYWNERRLRGATTAPAQPAAKTAATPVDVNAYPPEVVALIPQLAQLNPKGLFALKRLLADPEDASELLHSLSRLDPELVRRIRSLDRDARALLMGLAGD
jgi:hypothetical protein